MTTLIAALVLAIACSASAGGGATPELPRSLWRHTDDFAMMWWMHGLRDERKVFAIQTSRYALAFDVPAFRLTHLMPWADPPTEAEALTQANETVFGESNASLKCTLTVDGLAHHAAEASSNFQDSHLVEGGKFFQRRTVNKIAWGRRAPAVESSLEVAAWPDRLTLLLRVTPKNAIADGALVMTLATEGGFAAAAEPDDATVETLDSGHGWTVRLAVGGWPAGEEKSLALILRPGDKPDPDAVEVTAYQSDPIATPLAVTYDPVMGWHEVALRNDTKGGRPFNDRMERVMLDIANPSAVACPVRLNFAKGRPREGGVFGITGLTAMLRDTAGNPTGIPIQISKNWHTKPDRYRGPWYRGLTMLTLPAGETVRLEYTSVNALWGGVPAASHAQLCLVGWGNNQLWEEAAIGAWGETLCFEPDQGQVGGAVLDTRPLMVSAFGNEPGTKWGWTANVGGADFLVYTDPAGHKQWNSRMKTRHRRLGPVLTEVTYAGRSHDSGIDLQYTVSLHRTDDISRGIYHFRYDVRAKTAFDRLVLFQVGGDNYSYTGERKFAFGNEDGLIREWDTQWGGNQYRTEPFEATGSMPWFSMHEAVSRAEGREAWANRGFVIRQWTARLGGREAAPWAAERGAKVRGTDTSLIDIVPPPSVAALEAGDFVEATVEHIVMPQFAADYYGPNQNLRAALAQNQNTWRMMYREARGNDLWIDVSKGELSRQRPTLIQAQDDRAEFAVTGGLGYVPITLAGLSDYRTPVLEIQEGQTWTAVGQEVHGKDFWQADYRADDDTWEITYSLPLDSPGDSRIQRRFRFRLRER